MSTVYSQDFSTLALTELSGQDGWVHGASHDGGSIDVITSALMPGQLASLSTQSGNKTTNYERTFAAPIEMGIWYKTAFSFLVSSSFPEDCLVVSSILDENGDSLWDLEAGPSGEMMLYERSVGMVPLGFVTVDTPHAIDLSVDENLVIAVNIDGTPAATGLQRFGGRPSTIVLDSGPNTVIQSDVHYWDNLTIVTRTAYNVYKYYVGK